MPEEKPSKSQGFRAAKQWHFHAVTFFPVLKAVQFHTNDSVHAASEGEGGATRGTGCWLWTHRDAAAAFEGLQASSGCGQWELHLQPISYGT